MTTSDAQSLAQLLDSYASPGELYKKLAGGAVQCHACAHRCPIPMEHRGVCKVRFNRNGTLMVPHGYVAGLNADPIEKKPFFHVMPGASVLTFGMLGCNFRCQFCQNWLSSQALKDEAAGAAPQPITPAVMATTGPKFKVPCAITPTQVLFRRCAT